MVTVEFLKSFSSVQEAIVMAQKEYGEYPWRPRRPSVWKSNPSIAEVEKYAVLLKDFESKQEEYKRLQKEYSDRRAKVDVVVEEYIKDMSGLNRAVPEKYREKLWKRANEEGHSSGYLEIYNILCDLVEIFEEE